jgi:hypothetical protein
MTGIFFIGGLAANYQALRKSFKSNLGPLPGPRELTHVVLQPAMARLILLPLALDPWLVLLVLRRK